MDNIADKLNYLQDTKLAIKNAINGKGGTINSTTPFRDYADSIELIESGGSTPSSDEWVRPSDRPPLPFNDVENGTDLPDNTIYMLYGVQPDDENLLSFMIVAENIDVDWGDGVTENHTGGIDLDDSLALNWTGPQIQYRYNYDSITTKPDKNGIKWIWIKISGNTNIYAFYNMYMLAIPSLSMPLGVLLGNYSFNIYEMYAKFNECKSIILSFSNNLIPFNLTFSDNLEILKIYGHSKLINFFEFLYGCRNLRNLSINSSQNLIFYLDAEHFWIDTESTTPYMNYQNLLAHCPYLKQPVTLKFGTMIGEIQTYYLLLISSLLNNSPNIETVTLDFSDVNPIEFMESLIGAVLFNNYNKINIIVPSQLTNLKIIPSPSMFGMPNLSTSSIDIDFNFNSNVQQLVLVNVEGNIKLKNLNPLTINEILYMVLLPNSEKKYESFFNDLEDRSSTTVGTIYIKNTYSLIAPNLTPEQRAIATSKNWTIVE